LPALTVSKVIDTPDETLYTRGRSIFAGSIACRQNARLIAPVHFKERRIKMAPSLKGNKKPKGKKTAKKKAKKKAKPK
jgi:hypothetical protein